MGVINLKDRQDKGEVAVKVIDMQVGNRILGIYAGGQNAGGRLFRLPRLLMLVGWIGFSPVLLSGCASLLGDRQSSKLAETEIKETGPYSDQELASAFQNLELSVEMGDSGVTIRLEGLLFKHGETRLSPEAEKTLQPIAALLNDPRAVGRLLSVEGHTDSVGSDEFNQKLSRERAETVARELIFNRVQAERIKVRGWGEQHPLLPNTRPDGRDDPAARARNRRVEIVVQGLSRELLGDTGDASAQDASPGR